MKKLFKIITLISILNTQGALANSAPLSPKNFKFDLKKIQIDLKQIKRDKLLIENITKLKQGPNGKFIFSEDDSGGFSSGGGGNAVVCFSDERGISEISLLDYVEGLRKDQSLEKSVYLNGKTVREKIISAFERMGRRWPFLAEKLERNALRIEREMQQNLMSAQDGKLTPITDMDVTFVPNKNAIGDQCQIVRFAVQEKNLLAGQRKFNFVRDLYEHPRTSETTKAGIIIHEVLYEEAIKYGAEDSNFVRWLTYLISSPSFEILEADDFKSLELDKGSEFLKRSSIDQYRNGAGSGDFDTEYMEYKENEPVFLLDVDSNTSSNCLRYGICDVQKGRVASESDSSTDFYLKYLVESTDRGIIDLPVADIAKVNFRGCFPGGECVGDMVKVQKFTPAGLIRFEGIIVGIFGEGDYAVKVLKKSLKLPRSLQKEVKSDSDKDLIIFAQSQNTRLKQ